MPCCGCFLLPIQRFSALRRAVLGSISLCPLNRPTGRLSFSALRRAVLGSMRAERPGGGRQAEFQCSPTSRVGVNWPSTTIEKPPPRVSVLSDEPCWGQCEQAERGGGAWAAFQCSPTSRVGVNSDLAAKASPSLPFQCSPTSRVGVNSEMRQRPTYASREFQCSPTSRVGVNANGPWVPTGYGIQVSVLSDEPCWGQ